MSLKKALIFGFIVSSQILNAQTNFKPGFIVKNSTDTLYGNIDYRGDLLMGEICKFESDNKEVITFSPKEIVAYKFNEGRYFVSKEVNGQSVFLEYLSKGKINLYYLRDKVGDHFYIDKEGLRLSEIIYKEELINVGYTKYSCNTTVHIGVLKIYMQDAPILKDRIENFKIPDNKTLIDLAEDYNKLWEGDQNIRYQRRQPLLGVNIEITCGVINLINEGDLIKNTYVMGGVYAHLWMPRVNEKMYFRTGLIFNRQETIDNKSIIFKIPLQLEYIYPKSTIRPKFAAGVNIYRNLNHTVAFMGGLDIKISATTYASVSYDIDFIPLTKVPVIPEKAKSQSLSIGFSMNF